MAPVSFAQPKTSAQGRPMICSDGFPIMSAKALLAYTMRESIDCTQTPSSIASSSVSHLRSEAHSHVCEVGCVGGDDSSFVVIFYLARRPNPFEFLQSDSLQAIPLPVTQVGTVILQHTMNQALAPTRLGYFLNRWGISRTGRDDPPV